MKLGFKILNSYFATVSINVQFGGGFSEAGLKFVSLAPQFFEEEVMNYILTFLSFSPRTIWYKQSWSLLIYCSYKVQSLIEKKNSLLPALHFEKQRMNKKNRYPPPPPHSCHIRPLFKDLSKRIFNYILFVWNTSILVTQCLWRVTSKVLCFIQLETPDIQNFSLLKILPSCRRLGVEEVWCQLISNIVGARARPWECLELLQLHTAETEAARRHDTPHSLITPVTWTASDHNMLPESYSLHNGLLWLRNIHQTVQNIQRRQLINKRSESIYKAIEKLAATCYFFTSKIRQYFLLDFTSIMFPCQCLSVKL